MSMRKHAGRICIALGVVLVCAAAGLMLWNRHEARQAGAAAQHVLPALMEAISEGTAPSVPELPQETEGTPPTLPQPEDPTMREVVVEGHGYIGYLSIPALELSLPVMNECGYDAMKLAPGRYYGWAASEDLVIAGHNYPEHFGHLEELKEGDRIFLTDMDGRVWRYEVAAVDILAADAVEEMTSGEYALTLFTCTYGAASRITVRCDRTFGR